jgi:protein phosphatase PTC2/3
LKHFSNRPYEEQAVIGTPDIVEMTRSKDDNFVLLGCDGVWEKYVDDSQKMVEHLKRIISRYNDKEVMENLLE